MNCDVHCKTPISCSGRELADFASLVREGFDGSDEDLPDRIRMANQLAFHYHSGSELAAIAALKSPHRGERARQFEIAGVQTTADHELGWVYVEPRLRGRRIARTLCALLLARVPGTGVYATTRSNNEPMKRILSTLGFVQTGKPFPHRRRNEELVLFLRRGDSSAVPDAQ